MSSSRSFVRVLAGIASAALVVSACGGASDSPAAAGGAKIVIASFGTPESDTLAQIYGAALTNAGADVTYSLKLGDGDAVRPALERGEIDLVPEYAGSYLSYLDARQTAGVSAADAVTKIKTLAQEKEITVGQPSEASDGEALVVTKELANSKGLTTISDLRKLDAVTLVGPPGCDSMQTCLVGLESVYGLSKVAFLPGDNDANGATIKKALSDGKAQVARLSSSDPDLAKSGKFVVLEDDKSYERPGNVVPVVRASKATPGLLKVLDNVSKAITNDKLLDLNKKTETDREDPAAVAAEFVLTNKL